MSRTTRCLAAIGVIATSLSLLGCPQPPALLVEPAALSFSATDTTNAFRIRNSGEETLSWTVSWDAPWMSVTQPALKLDPGGSISGTTTTDVANLEVTVDRDKLDPGLTTADIAITSDGGDSVVTVSVTEAGPAVLVLSDTVLNLGLTGESGLVLVSNAGQSALDWELALPATAPWLSATPQAGTLADNAAAPSQVTVSVDRSSLPADTYSATIDFSSNGGNESLAVTFEVAPFTVLPASLDYGNLALPETRNLIVGNNRNNLLPLSVEAATDDGGDWLVPGFASADVPAASNLQVPVTADPTGLPPGTYTGTVTLTATDTGDQRTVTASLSVTTVTLNKTLFDFGVIVDPATDQLILTNEGGAPLPWTLDVPASASAWLSADKTSGTLVSSETITLSVDPMAVDPNQYEALLDLAFEGAEEEITVRMARPKPAKLRAEPNDIDFSTSRNTELIGIWNDGIGSIDWTIDSSAFPAWLSITPSSNGIASGTVAGDQTDAATLILDRDKIPAGTLEVSHSFQVLASGDDDEPVDVSLRATVPLVPRIAVEADGVDATGIDFVDLDVDEDSAALSLLNTGNGNLDWAFNLIDLPAWITSIDPAQGEIDPGGRVRVTITVSRDTLDYTGAQHTLQIDTNDPGNPVTPLLVEVLVPKHVAIRTRPGAIAFGLDEISDVLEVANDGDPDTILSFQIISSKEWLSVYPETGRSIGSASALKDWQPVSVSVDRAQLDGRGASAKLTIFAYLIEDGVPVPDENVEPVEVNVSVEAPELTIEAAKPRLRVPSLLRFVLLMRNVQYQALPIPNSRLDDVAELFGIFENEIGIESTETNQFLTPVSRVRTNILLLLDYSGSMQAAAGLVSDASIANADDPIQALYEATIPQMIDEFPDNYRIGLALFNERGERPIREIRGDAAESEATRDRLFLRDKEVLKQRLRNVEVVDNGATELLPALEAATFTLVDEDNPQIPFDDADVRAIVCVSDGRLTTPPGNIMTAVRYISEERARLFCIGWGDKVNSEPLIRLTTGTGGHLYATKAQPTGEFDPFGLPVRIPVVEELRNWCVTDPADVCDQSVPNDFKSQVVFSYVTLNEETSVNFEGRLTFDDPNDQNSPCLDEQGEISGAFSHKSLDYSSIVGDPRLGQISLETEGLGVEASLVRVRAEFIPRNITRMAFRITAESSETVTTEVTAIPGVIGGIVAHWTLTKNGDDYTLESPDGTPLHYGEFGELLNVTVQGATEPFVLRFDVIEPVADSGIPDTKYFIYPDSITVNEEPFLASAFPVPLIATSPDFDRDDEGITVDLGDTLTTATIRLFNGGGSFVYPNGLQVGLLWEAAINPETEEEGRASFDIDPDAGIVLGTDDFSDIIVSLDRTQEPGAYIGRITFTYIPEPSMQLRIAEPVFITYVITEADLGVSTDTLAFGETDTALPLTVSNTGNSSLSWAINTELFPPWLTTAVGSGMLGSLDELSFNLYVWRAGLTAGTYSHTFTVTAGNQTQDVTVTVTVP